MGGELLGDEGVYEGDDADQPENDQDVREDIGESQEAAGEKEQTIDNVVEVLSKTVSHYFPQFNEWLKGLKDVRDQEAIEYKRETIVWTALIMLLTKRKARGKITEEMRTENLGRNLKELCGQEDLQKVPHGDTVEYLCRRLQEEELEELQVKMMRNLFRGRVLERYRLLGKYHTIAIDGCHVHSFDYKHCEHCLVVEDSKGKKRWFHAKLQASLVTPTGLCLPMASEWIENEKDYVKQDCELRAFYRLIKKLRRYYSRLPMCILLDGLYAAEPVFKALNQEEMEWIVVFKEGSMSFIYNWVMDIKRILGKENVIVETNEQEIEERQRRSHPERLIRKKAEHKKRTRVQEITYSWMAGVEYSEDRNPFNILTCKETVDGQERCDYVWVVSNGLNLNEDTVKPLAKAGRCRWKIENEGINTQKNGGYRLEHLYSKDEVSIKIWIKILDLAHLINQLIEKGSLIVQKVFGSIGNISSRMFEHFQYFVLKKSSPPSRFQIRLRWDTS